MRLKPGSHITIEISPYTPKFVARHRHGCTHLVRLIEREAVLDHTKCTGGASEDGSNQPYIGGKIRNIFEQQIVSGDDNIGIANALRRWGEWQRPARKRKPKSRLAKHVRAAVEVGGGFGSGSDYREA